MAKGKKRKKQNQARKQRAAAKQKLSKMSWEQLAARAADSIAQDKIRDGIESYKQALKNDGDPAILLPGLFYAYFLRFKELKDKKMPGEAKVVQDMGACILEQIPLPNHDVLKTCVLFLPMGVTSDAYLKYLGQNEPLGDIEKNIGSRLVTENCLELAQKFDASSALRQDAPVVEAAQESMDSGLWDQAFRLMRKVSRKSPYADIKGFAKAMIAFGRGDRVSLAKALDGLDKGFPLEAAPLVLDGWANDLPVDPLGKKKRTTRLLMGDAVLKDRYRRNLEDALAQENAVAMEKWIKSLAGLLRFKSVEVGVTGILEIIGTRLVNTENEVDCLQKLVNRVMGSSYKGDSLFSKILSGTLNFLSFYTPDYLGSLNVEFPDERDRQTALSVILVWMITAIGKDSDSCYDSDEELEEIFYFLKMPVDVVEDGEEQIIFHLAQKAMAADPENQDVYDILLGLPITTPAMRKSLVPCLEKMVDVYDRDHRACLKLARIFYMKNAYRKAQKSLFQAYERAPHDLQVKEEYALSFVIAASGNLKRGKIDLADRDLEKAHAFNLRGINVFIAEKKLVSDCLRTNKFSKDVFEGLTQGFAFHEKLKAFLLFMLDLADPGFDSPINHRGVDTFLKKMKTQTETLDFAGTYDLLSPLKGSCEKLFSTPFYIGPLLEKRGKILDRLDDEGFISLIVDLVLSDCRGLVVRQIANRRKRKGNELKLVFDFYHAAFEYMDRKAEAAPRLDAIAKAPDAGLKNRLKKISRSLAQVAPYPVRDDFSQFDFSQDDDWARQMGDWDEEDWDDEEWDDEDEAILDDVINRFIQDFSKKGGGKVTFSFDPVPIFGKGSTKIGLGLAAEKLAGAACVLVNRLPDEDGYDVEAVFRDCFTQFMALVSKAGPTDAAGFRQAGRDFARQFAPAKEILRGMDICRISIGGMENQHFIMGMRTGI